MKRVRVRTDADRAKANAWQKAHPEYVKVKNARYNEKNKAKRREYRLKTKFNITQADFDAMLAKQGGRCAICRTDKPGGRFENFHVDHDHVTGKVRSLLCNDCNTGIGKLKDDPWVLFDAATYLWKHQEAA